MQESSKYLDPGTMKHPTPSFTVTTSQQNPKKYFVDLTERCQRLEGRWLAQFI